MKSAINKKDLLNKAWDALMCDMIKEGVLDHSFRWDKAPFNEFTEDRLSNWLDSIKFGAKLTYKQGSGNFLIPTLTTAGEHR